MTVLLTAATDFEIQPLRHFLENQASSTSPGSYQIGPLEVQILISGVGLTATTYHLTKRLHSTSFDLVIQAGIAGAFDRRTELGSVFQVISEQFADLGVEEKDGSFTDLFELELQAPDDSPFIGGKLYNHGAAPFGFLPKAAGLTVHKVQGSAAGIAAVKEKYEADLESMEGAAFFYVCLQEQVPFLAIRSVSNYVEPRNRAAWKIGLAIDQLNQVLEQLLSGLADLE